MNLDALTITTEDLRRELPIPFVMAAYGHTPAAESPGRLHYKNPWRQDNTPSLDVFTNDQGVQRAGDFASGFQGGVLDVIGLFEKVDDLKSILGPARKLYARYLEDGWDGPVVEAASQGDREMDAETLVNIYASPVVKAGNPVLVELVEGNPGVNPSVVADFDVRVYRDRLAIPYPDGEAIRIRHLGGVKTYVKGSTPGLYFHPDLDLAAAPSVLLVEGESDTWAATSSSWAGAVVGIPGVGHQPGKWLPQLEGKTVVIAFDGDKAGREGATRWHQALVAAGCDVQIVPIPDGEDVAGMATSEFNRLLEMRRALVKNNTGMQALAGGYAVEGRKDGEFKHISNWIVEPVRILHYEDETPRAFEVLVRVDGDIATKEPVLLTFEDMDSSRKLHRWASQFSGAWWGGNTDHHKLRAVIEEQAAFLPVDVATNRPGLYHSTFVYPGGAIGDASAICVPSPQFPLTDANAFSLHPGPATPAVTVHRLLNMHLPEVTHTLAAWLAMAPLRSLYEQFPPCFVTGRAGSGKTTVVAEFLRVLGGVDFVTNLTSTTPYALTLTMGGTNSFPTWFDEYRRGARVSAMDMMNQLLRDAYNKAPSRRGGMGEDKSRVTTINTDNPLIVSGEDLADEQSHRDRLVKVFVPREGKGLLPLWTDEDLCLAHDYLSWLTERRDQGHTLSWVEQPPELDASPYLNAGVSERQAYNLSVLDAGWRLLTGYVFDRTGQIIPSTNWGHLLDTNRAEAMSDPVAEALLIAYEAKRDTNALWADNDGNVYVSSALVMLEFKDLDIQLPFDSARAMTMYLCDAFAGEQVRVPGPSSVGKQIRYVKVSRDRIPLANDDNVPVTR